MWTQIKHLLYLLCNLTVAHFDITAPISVNINTDRLGHTNGISKLHKHFFGHACSYHVLGNITCCIGCRTVDFRWVLTRESTSSMCSLATICVDNNLASRQPRISVRPADDKLTRRIDEIFNVVIEQRQYFLTQLCLYAWHENIDNVFTYLGQHRLIIVHERVVLRAHDNRVNALRQVVVAVFHRYLAL